jgi:hypothetical protein
MLLLIIVVLVFVLSILSAIVLYYVYEYCDFPDGLSFVWLIFTVLFGISSFIGSGVAIGTAIRSNVMVEAKHYEALQKRNTLVVQLEYYENYGTNIIKSETAVREYTQTLYQVKEFNSKIYKVELYKDNKWIGLFQEKWYIGIEPIKYQSIILG